MKGNKTEEKILPTSLGDDSTLANKFNEFYVSKEKESGLLK